MVMNKRQFTFPALVVLGLALGASSACRKRAPQPPPGPAIPPAVQPVVIELPAGLMDGGLGRLVNPGKAFIYFRSLNLLVFVHEWANAAVIRNSAEILARISRDPAFARAAEFWTVQTDREYAMKDFRRLVVTVTPRAASDYDRDRDLEKLFLDAVYVKFGDIPYSLTPDQRRELLAGRDPTANGPLPFEGR